MMRLVEAPVFCLIAVGVHAAAWVALDTGGIGVGESAPPAVRVSAAPADPGMAALVAGWRAPPEIAASVDTGAAPVTDPGPVTVSAVARVPDAPPLPRMGAAEAAGVAPVTNAMPAVPAPVAPAPAPDQPGGPDIGAEASVARIAPSAGLRPPRPEGLPLMPPPAALAHTQVETAAPVRSYRPEVGASQEVAPPESRDAPPTLAAMPPPQGAAPPGLPGVDRQSALPPATESAVARSERPRARPAPVARRESRTATREAKPPPAPSSQGSGSGAANRGAKAEPARRAGNRAAARGLSAGQRNALMARWGGQIGARIQSRAPHVGRSTRVVVRLTVRRNGRLVSVGVSRSSGDPRIDRAALAAVRKAGRFPRAPSALPGESHVFSLPIRFR